MTPTPRADERAVAVDLHEKIMKLAYRRRAEGRLLPAEQVLPLIEQALAAAKAEERARCQTIALDLFKSKDAKGRMSHPQRYKWEAGKKIAAALAREVT